MERSPLRCSALSLRERVRRGRRKGPKARLQLDRRRCSFSRSCSCSLCSSDALAAAAAAEAAASPEDSVTSGAAPSASTTPEERKPQTHESTAHAHGPSQEPPNAPCQEPLPPVAPPRAAARVLTQFTGCLTTPSRGTEMFAAMLCPSAMAAAAARSTPELMLFAAAASGSSASAQRTWERGRRSRNGVREGARAGRRRRHVKRRGAILRAWMTIGSMCLLSTAGLYVSRSHPMWRPEASRTIRRRSAIWCGATYLIMYGVMYRLPHSCGTPGARARRRCDMEVSRKHTHAGGERAAP